MNDLEILSAIPENFELISAISPKPKLSLTVYIIIALIVLTAGAFIVYNSKGDPSEE